MNVIKKGSQRDTLTGDKKNLHLQLNWESKEKRLEICNASTINELGSAALTVFGFLIFFSVVFKGVNVLSIPNHSLAYNLKWTEYTVLG